MIIPVRCFTCGKVLADKWRDFERKCKAADDVATDSSTSTAQQQLSDHAPDVHIPPNFGKKFHGKILDELGLDKICCRRHMLGHVDMMQII